ncbi:neutral zinc metallopeptidase [Nocardiopsis coralli]|uniref:neutral zinc metallopeptidase n=1 Tax=Nocardiopsis coralli TaxID=2772213 RepID=UPI002E2BA471|nr:neutral zinc metallopeptidase [Nocardiopsis coralli]
MENRPGPDHRQPPFDVPPVPYAAHGAQGPYAPKHPQAQPPPQPEHPRSPPPPQGFHPHAWDGRHPHDHGHPPPAWDTRGPQPPAWAPPPSPRPPDEGIPGVVFGAVTAGAVAVTAMAASVLMVVNGPREDPSPVPGTDLSTHYDEDLLDRPVPMEIDLVEHPLYDAPMPEAVDCDLPSLETSSDESWLEFSTAAGECLDTVWAPVMEDLGLHPEPVEFEVSTDSPDADNADGYTLAYYEIDHHRITVVLPNVRELGENVPDSEQEMVWLALMGHEYGHHVQYATGILPVTHDLRRDAENDSEELDTLRRTELQAECMAGVALGSIAEVGSGDLETVNEHFNSGGDLETHGRATNRAFWLEQGWAQDTVGGCNTYEAEQRRVT